jgi:ribonuclease HI
MKDSDVIIYTDGSSRGNPGPGGYGIVMEHCKSGYVKEYSKGFKLTTNNRMELLAVIEALKKLKQSNLKIIVYTDSNMLLIPLKKNGYLNGKN